MPASRDAAHLTTDSDAAALLGRDLAPGESVWAVVPGASGDSLVATDRRLFHVRRGVANPDAGWPAWSFEELSEIRPIGGRPGQLPGRFLIEDADHVGPRISFAIDPARREEAMQAVTIVQLLIARARSTRLFAQSNVSARVRAAGAAGAIRGDERGRPGGQGGPAAPAASIRPLTGSGTTARTAPATQAAPAPSGTANPPPAEADSSSRGLTS